jgi:hypothetical protein
MQRVSADDVLVGFGSSSVLYDLWCLVGRFNLNDGLYISISYISNHSHQLPPCFVLLCWAWLKVLFADLL